MEKTSAKEDLAPVSALYGDDLSVRFAAIIESSDDAIISKDLNGIVVTWNKAAEKLFGYAAEEIIGEPITRIFPSDRLAEEVDILARIRHGERIEHYETVRQRKDGILIPISLTVSPIQDPSGRVIGASKIARDMTARKQARERQDALYEFTNRLFRAQSADDIYEAALDAIVRALACERASILLFEDAGVARFVAARGLSMGYRQAVEGHSPWRPDSKDPEPITVEDIGSADIEEALKETIKAEGIAALAFIPLATKGQVLGKFMAYYAAPHRFSQSDIDVAVTIARQLVFGLERMRAEAARQLLLGESKHRIKNTLATVQAIATQTLRHGNEDDLQKFTNRLHALSDAHDLLTSGDWHQALLGEVLGRALKPFGSDRIVIDGPSLLISANTALQLTLCLHELATNAVKYGALCNSTGHVHLSARAVDTAGGRRLRLVWQEKDGPPVELPEQQGFGSRLILSTAAAGTQFNFDPDGVNCTLEFLL